MKYLSECWILWICKLLFLYLALVFFWCLFVNNNSLDILVDGGRRVRRPVTPSMVESEAGRRMSAARTSISDVRISSSGRPSLSELGLGKATKWQIPACSDMETEKYHEIYRLNRYISYVLASMIFLTAWLCDAQKIVIASSLSVSRNWTCRIFIVKPQNIVTLYIKLY